MVSFFGIKFGEKKKKQPLQPQPPKRVDQNTLGEGQLFGHAIHQTGVINGSLQSIPRPGTAQSSRSVNFKSPYVHNTHNMATTSMHNLSDDTNPHLRPGQSKTLGIKPHASDANLRTKFTTDMNAPALSSSSSNLSLPGSGFGSRPRTANEGSKTKQWVSPLDIHFMKPGNSSSLLSKSPMSPLATQPMIVSEDVAEIRTAAALVDETSDAGDTVVAIVASRMEKEKEEELAKSGLEKHKVNNLLKGASKPPSPHQQSPPPQQQPQQRPANGPQGATKGGGPDPLSTLLQPKGSLVLPSRDLHGRRALMALQTSIMALRGRCMGLLTRFMALKTRFTAPQAMGLPNMGLPNMILRTTVLLTQALLGVVLGRDQTGQARTELGCEWWCRSFRVLALKALSPSRFETNIETLGPTSPEATDLSPRSPSPARGLLGGSDPSRLQRPPKSMAGSLSESLNDESPIEQFGRPIIRNVAAKRDTYTMNSPRRHSLSMEIEELEKKLVDAQLGRSLGEAPNRILEEIEAPQKSPGLSPGLRGDVRDSFTSSFYSDDEDDDDQPILAVGDFSDDHEDHDEEPIIPIPSPLRVTPSPAFGDSRQQSPAFGNSRQESPVRGLPMRALGQRPRRPALEEYGVSSSLIVANPFAQAPTPALTPSPAPLRAPSPAPSPAPAPSSVPVPLPIAINTNVAPRRAGSDENIYSPSSSRSNTPQLRHPNWAAAATAAARAQSPALAPDAAMARTPTPTPLRLTPSPIPSITSPVSTTVSPISTTLTASTVASPTSTTITSPASTTITSPLSAVSSFKFSFNDDPIDAPPTPDSTNWPMASPTARSQSPMLQSPLNRTHAPAPLTFNFSPDAFSREQGPWTPPLRTPSRNGPTGDDERPSTAIGVRPGGLPLIAEHGSPPGVLDQPPAQTPVDGMVIDIAAALGIGVARGLSVREPKQLGPPPRKNRTPLPPPMPDRPHLQPKVDKDGFI
ncbi:hypothetical protein B0T17DRAFT_614196 [Bombardia bombarda]|uniref:Uncharacterized protein n=1 Tax=Bombardia bombarda TaxID=252184 RepID=A0AA39X7M9_9PEZI|nr:hypothetical protein B0T17DRAFT_614196 [Bombardia bombarda]